MRQVTTTTEGAIWSRVIRPERRDLSREAARAILRFQFDPQDRRRMRALAEKARQGTLTPADEEAIRTYERVGSVLSLM